MQSVVRTSTLKEIEAMLKEAKNKRPPLRKTRKDERLLIHYIK